MASGGANRILVIDAEESGAEETKSMLREARPDFTIEIATNTADVHTRLKETAIEGIIASNDLADGSGLKLLEAIRETHPDLPFILYPRDGSEKLASKAVNAGVTNYVPRRDGTDHEATVTARLERALQKTSIEESPTDDTEPIDFNEVITDIADELFRASAESFEATIETCLERVGSVADADRAVVYQLQDDDTIAKTHEWSGKGIDSGLETGQTIPKYKLSWWLEQLQSFEPVVVPSVTDLPPEATIEQELLEKQPVQSLVTAPLVQGDQLIGFVGIDRTEQTDGWNDDHIELLQSIARLLSSALDRETRRHELERKEAILEQSSDIISVMSADGSVTYQSESTERVTHFQPQEIMGGSAFEHIHPADQETVMNQFGSFVTNPGNEITTDLRVKSKDGAWRWIEVRGQNKLADPHIDGLLFSSRDITDRKQRERSHKQLRERLDLAIDGAGLGVWDWDMRTDEVEFNERWGEMLGYSLDDIEPRLEAWKKRVHPDDMEVVEAALDAHIAGETAYYEAEHRMRTADGDWKWVRDIGRVAERTEEGEPVRAVGIHIDIDDRKSYEQRLEQSRKTLRQVIDLVPDLIFAKNRDGKYLLANERTAETYGLTPEAIEGKPESEVIPHIEDSEKFRKDDLEVIESGDPKFIPEEEITTEGGETRILQTTKIPFEMPGSGEDAILGYARDVTDLKAYEDRLESQRDSLKVLNQVVRHDIRNQLQVVLASAELVKERNQLPEESAIEQVIIGTKEAVEITEVAREVTDFMEDPSVEPEPVALDQVLQEVTEEVASSYEDAIVKIEGSLPGKHVLADDMLNSVFRNLLTNAIHHNDKPEPVVTASATVGTESVVVRIADNGPGIPEDQKAEIFDEGKSRLQSEGRGLGLYLVETLVDRYGGALTVEDNEPTGSVFVLELPIARANGQI